MGRHAMGPWARYVLRNECNAPSRSKSPSYMSAMRITTSGLRRPWAVWKEGRVVLETSTESLMIMLAVAGRPLLNLVVACVVEAGDLDL